METPAVVAVLILFIIGGHLIQIVFERDDWPFAAYTMYAHLVADKRRSPFVPLRPEHAPYEAGFLVLAVIRADGSSVPLTTAFAHPLLRPLDRLRVIRMLTDRYKNDCDVSRPVADFAAWVAAQNQRARTGMDLVALELQLYLWKAIPEQPRRHHAPDEIRVIERAPIGRAA